jgi:hypothetical protein
MSKYLFRSFHWYSNILERKPFVVTSISTGICYGIGDYFAQNIEIRQKHREKIDYHRLAVFTGFGLIMSGPLYYAWFSKIDKMPIFLENVVRWNEKRILANNFKRELKTQNVANISMKVFREQYKDRFEKLEKPIIRSKTILVSKVLADQLIFSSLYPIFFMIMTGILLDNTKYDTIRTISYQQIKNSYNKSWLNIKEKYFEIYKTDCAVWPMAQMINFAFISPHMQPIFVNVGNIAWNTYLSYTSQSSH